MFLRHGGGGGGGADVNVELTPLCSPNFKPGKPSELSQYIATILNRLVRTYVFPPAPAHHYHFFFFFLFFSTLTWAPPRTKQRRTDLVDESVLRIEDKEEESKERKAMMWYLYVDMYCLDYDGNVFDACLIALLSALANGTPPSLEHFVAHGHLPPVLNVALRVACPACTQFGCQQRAWCPRTTSSRS